MANKFAKNPGVTKVLTDMESVKKLQDQLKDKDRMIEMLMDQIEQRNCLIEEMLLAIAERNNTIKSFISRES